MTNKPDPRLAYEIYRYHTWPVIRKQSIGEHSAQIYRLLLSIWPIAPRHVFDHAMTHDTPECVTGDPPYPVKAHNPEIKEAYDRMEGAAYKELERVWLLPQPTLLSPLEYRAFKFIEYLEMAEYGQGELQLGNNHARVIVRNMNEALHRSALDLGSLWWLLNRARVYLKQRNQAHADIVEGSTAPAFITF